MHRLMEGVRAAFDEREAADDALVSLSEGGEGDVVDGGWAVDVVQREVGGLLLVGGNPAGPGAEGGDGDAEGDVLVVIPVVELVGRDRGAGFGVDEEQGGSHGCESVEDSARRVG